MTEANHPTKIVVYSDDRTVREQVRLALGHKVARDLPEIEISEVATLPALLRLLDADSDYGLVVLDGEARPGGFGISHQLREEYADCPPILLLVARSADGWLGTWSRAEALAPLPVDPVQLPQQVAQLLRDAAKTSQAPVN